MSNKQKKIKLQEKRENLRAKREEERLEKLADEGRLANGVVLPHGAVAADLSEQAPNGSYSPPLYYVDQPFTCVDCGVEDVWTAERQKWYYEVAKGSIYARAIRCRPCRHKHNVEAEDGDSSPFKHPAIILAEIRDAIEPSLAAAGFKFDGRNKPPRPVHLYLDYSSGNELFRLSWDRRDSNQFIGFVAEIIHEPDVFKTIISKDLSYIAKLPCNAVTSEVQMQINAIVESINDYLKGLADSSLPIEESSR